MKKALLILPDNTIFRGDGIGAFGSFYGELVFNTGMTGYVESLTDPSYARQILTFNYPLIGNYGVSEKWFESKKIHPTAIVANEICETPEHFESQRSFESFLLKQKVGGIIGVDTREIVKKIREHGTVPAVVSVYEEVQQDWVREVSTKKAFTVNPKGSKTVVLIDYGAKEGQLDQLKSRGLKVVVVPSSSTFQEIMSYHPDAILLSNGPGDPAELSTEISTIQELFETLLPIFGVCLGHQLLSLALGGKTYKLPYGHRGSNQPVMNLFTKKAYITSHNHGYSVDKNSLPKDVAVTFVNLNDQSVEGLKHKSKPWFSVQFHPEANPGPQDTAFLFDEFHKMI